MALILTMAALIFLMAAPSGRWTDVITLGLLGGALFASLRAAGAPERLRIACAVLVGLAILAAIGQAFAVEEVKNAYMRGASLLFVLLATPAIVLGLVKQIKVNRQVTVHTMMGVLCIYLLMSMAFAESFALIQVLGGEPFFRTGQGAEDLSNYLYFSITTITTAGLGDFSPAGDLGRSLTAAEALIGQIYLVTVVAVIVGNLGRRRSDGGDDSDRPAA